MWVMNGGVSAGGGDGARGVSSVSYERFEMCLCVSEMNLKENT